MIDESVWLKRCLACGKLNQPLAIECDHCRYNKFVWSDKDRPPHIQVNDSMEPMRLNSQYELDFETQVDLSIRGIYPFNSIGTTIWWPFTAAPHYYRKIENT